MLHHKMYVVSHLKDDICNTRNVILNYSSVLWPLTTNNDKHGMLIVLVLSFNMCYCNLDTLNSSVQ